MSATDVTGEERSQLERLIPLDGLRIERLSGEAFAPYAQTIDRFCTHVMFPSAAELNEVIGPALDDALGPWTVRFEHQRGKRKLASLADAYEARIDARGLVPTRACLHDFANALVWSVLPRSKRALAARQHDALRRDVPEFKGVLPGARSEERDVLSMIDEGAILITPTRSIVFGHALLEHLASSDAEVFGYPIELAACDLEALDRELATALVDTARFTSRRTTAIAVRAQLGL